MTPDQIIAVVTALLSVAPDPAAFSTILSGGGDPRYLVTVEACPANTVPPTEVEGSTVICRTDCNGLVSQVMYSGQG